jgi:hypothetical protein
MDVVRVAIVPRVVMPPTMMITIVISFLIALLVTGVVMNYLPIVYDTPG